ncbi:hypothetical protein BB558_001530 [Smittium angustum]|uniref:Uncharacterized protein n=1 Tax=Smittium angustum TaxID=133377 RepID=A0A2U1JBD0_SMIAN|nr:hypothetical protein BB558_001530 [Smittium angustum]
MDQIQNLDWEKIDEWLKNQYKDRKIPQYVKSKENYNIFFTTKLICEACDSLQNVYVKICKQENTSLQAQNVGYKEYLKMFENCENLEDLDFYKELNELAEISLDYGLDTISTHSITAAQSSIVYEYYKSSQDHNKIRNKIKEMKEKTASSQIRVEQYQRIIDNKTDNSSKIYEWNKGAAMLNERILEYKHRLAKMHTLVGEYQTLILNFNRIKSDIERIKSLYELVKTNENKLATYSNLPPDLQLAQIKLAELHQYHDKLLEQRNELFSKAFSEGMDSVLQS